MAQGDFAGCDPRRLCMLWKNLTLTSRFELLHGRCRFLLFPPRQTNIRSIGLKFGYLEFLQLPKPWGADAEHRAWKEGLDRVESADRAGIDHFWEVEHHFLEEYAGSSASESFLAAASQRTKR